ncbi:MAG: cellulose synthase operon protein YhjQ/BcsQ [Planctomycetota bacterium]
MTTPPPKPRPAQSPPPPGTALPIDPVKILKKYYLLLVITGVIAGVAGIGTYVLLMMFAPKYTASALFEARPPVTDFQTVNPLSTNQEELERLMTSQAEVMTSPTILDKVARDPRLPRRAPDWAAPFMDGTALDSTKARQALEEAVGAGMVRGTNFIRLSATASTAADAASLVGLVREQYLSDYNTYSRSETRRQIDSMNQTINAQETRIEALQSTRQDIIATNDVDFLDTRLSQSREEMTLLTRERQETNAARIEAETQLDDFERRIATPGELRFDDALIAEVEQSPLILSAKQEINALEGALQAARARGLGERHRDVRAIESRINGARATLDDLRQSELDSAFQGQVEGLRRAIAGFNAQILDLDEKLEAASVRNTELTQISTQLEDIERELAGSREFKIELESRMEELRAVTQDENTGRITEFQRERTPDLPSSPRLVVVAPGVFLAIFGTVCGLIVLRELLDQRVKGPSDIAMIPKAQLLGAIPDASEDPSRPENAARLMLDHPESVAAESFREVRPALSKMVESRGHKTLAVIGCAPGGGATSIAVGIGASVAGLDSRVLLIDANLRRPALHDLFDRARAPGLTDILSDQSTPEQAILSGVADGVDLLPVGSAELRRYERLGGERMRKLLASVSARYDLVILDVAPAIVASDATALAGCVDATILVARAMAEKRGLVNRISGQLGDANADFLGVIVNGVQASAGGYLRSNIRTAHRYQTALT